MESTDERSGRIQAVPAIPTARAALRRRGESLGKIRRRATDRRAFDVATSGSRLERDSDRLSTGFPPANLSLARPPVGGKLIDSPAGSFKRDNGIPV